MYLTNTQKAAFFLIKEGSVTYTTDGLVPRSNGGKMVQRRIIRQLKALGLIEGYGLHPWGEWPVYSFMLTDKGKELYKELKNEST